MTSIVIKRSYSYALAVFLAVIVNHFFSQIEPLWILMGALICMQTAVGLTVRQGVENYILLVISIGIGTFLALAIPGSILINAIACLLFIVCCYLSVKISPHFLLFGMVILISILLPTPLMNRFYDATFGAFIGILTNLLVFPRRADVEFRTNVISILNSYSAYLMSITQLMFKKENAGKMVAINRDLVEKKLQSQSNFFPGWVYQYGLSQSFQRGHRHFLVMIERLGQTLFSMHHIARHPFDPDLLHSLQEPIANYMDETQKILSALATVLYLKQISEGVSDLSEELDELEDRFKKVVPPSLELLDLSEDYIYLAALISDLKDLRATLMKLVQALR